MQQDQIILNVINRGAIIWLASPCVTFSFLLTMTIILNAGKVPDFHSSFVLPNWLYQLAYVCIAVPMFHNKDRLKVISVLHILKVWANNWVKRHLLLYLQDLATSSMDCWKQSCSNLHSRTTTSWKNTSCSRTNYLSQLIQTAIANCDSEYPCAFVRI